MVLEPEEMITKAFPYYENVTKKYLREKKLCKILNQENQ